MNDEEHEPAPVSLTEEELGKIPEELREKVSEVAISGEFHMIRSPLLPPSVLKNYDEVIPGLAEKLVLWTEAESEHRRAMENRGFEEIRKIRIRGQYFGLATSITGLVIAGILGVSAAVYGMSPAAVLGGVIAIVSVGGPFAARILAGRFGNNRDSEGDE